LKKKITIVLADDHVVVREGLKLLLSAEPDMVVVAEASNGRQAVLLAQELRPDIVVMDIAMPLMNGFEATCQIMSDSIPSRVLVLSAHGDDEYVHQLTEAGASGYLIKQTAGSDLVKAVREIAKGNAFFSPSVLKRLLELYSKSGATGRTFRRNGVKLSSGESEVLQMVANGHVNRRIASALGIGVKTVERRRQHLMDKIDIHDVAGLRRYAVAHGIVGIPGKRPGAHQILKAAQLGGLSARSKRPMFAAPAHP
jgi:DNA-binding NarL/FixJ family response regulator